METAEQKFEAYRETVIKSCAAPRQAQTVASRAIKNVCDTLHRDIKHLADDSTLLTMCGDKEWFDLWAASVACLLCSGEYPQAESFFAEYGIQA